MKTITPLKEEERNLNIKIYEIDTEYIVSPPRRGVTVMRLVGLTDYKELTEKHEADTLRASAEIKENIKDVMVSENQIQDIEKLYPDNVIDRRVCEEVEERLRSNIIEFLLKTEAKP